MGGTLPEYAPTVSTRRRHRPQAPRKRQAPSHLPAVLLVLLLRKRLLLPRTTVLQHARLGLRHLGRRAVLLSSQLSCKAGWRDRPACSGRRSAVHARQRSGSSLAKGRHGCQLDNTECSGHGPSWLLQLRNLLPNPRHSTSRRTAAHPPPAQWAGPGASLPPLAAPSPRAAA